MAVRAEEPWIPDNVEIEGAAPSEADPVLARVYRYPHEQPMRFDMHYALEAGVVLTGRHMRSWKRLEAALKPGDVWFCGSWEPHGWATAQAPCDLLVLFILPQMAAELLFPGRRPLGALAPFRVPPSERPRVPAPRRADVLRLADRFRSHLSDRRPADAPWRWHLFVELLLVVQEFWRPRSQTPASPPLMRGTLTRAVEMVFAERRLVTVSEAAEACGMGRNIFAEQFQRLMGLPFADFALRHRVSAAARDLQSTLKPLKAIARDWGFSDASHLSRCIKRFYGVTPGAHRRRPGK